MLVINVEWIIRLRGSKHPYAYLINHGFSEQQARSLLSKKGKRPHLDVVLRLTDIFRCKLDDVYDWTGEPDHRMAYLKKPELPELEEMLEDKSPDEILALFRGLGGEK